MILPGIYDTFQKKFEQYQSCYIYSDTHFSDRELEEGVKNRPTDEEHITKINSCIGRKDVLIHLGDVGNLDCARRLRAAYKILIMGNHDAGASNYKRVIEKRIFDRDNFPDKNAVLALMKTEFPNWKIEIREKYEFHQPFNRWVAYADNCLFDEVYEGALIIGEKLILSHEPIANINWALNIHGHQHNKNAKSDMFHFNVCSDVVNYTPINLNQFLKGGPTSQIQTIHRTTIDTATARKKKSNAKRSKN